MGDYEKAKELGISADSICGLLRSRFKSGQCVCASEVGARTGYCTRHVDFVAFHCWDSENYKIEAFEIKISKADLKRELEDPSKHNTFFDDIDTYWIVAPDFVLDDLDILPKKWGVMKVVSSDGELSLRVARKPIPLHDEQMKARRLGRPFAASMCRAMEEQSQTKRTLYEKQRVLEAEIRKKVERELAEGARVVPNWKYDDLERCERMCKELNINTYYSDMSDVAKEKFKEAREVANRLGYLDTELRTAASTIKYIRSMIKGVMSGKDAKSDPAASLNAACKALEAKHRKLWVVTFVEYGDSVDGKARVLGLFDAKDKAHAAMEKAATQYRDDLELSDLGVFDYTASVGATDECRCEFRMDEVSVPESEE